MFKIQHGPPVTLSTHIQSVSIVRRLEDIASTGSSRRTTSSVARFSSDQYWNMAIGNWVRIRAANNSTRNVIESTVDDEVVSTVESEGESIDVKAVVMLRKKMKGKISDKIGEWMESITKGIIGGAMLIQLVSEDIDPDTKSGKILECYAGSWLPKASDNPSIVEYTANFIVPSDFRRPGAIILTNFHDKEVHLVQIVIHGFGEGPITFPANTWIHSWKDDPDSRIIFRNQAYLPHQTAPGIRVLRREDLLKIRGNGNGERKRHERVYDYALYNDLGNPDKSNDLSRPVFGGEERPYPRRCRTGRSPTKTDPCAESIAESPHPVYVPRDEAFEEIKEDTLSAKRWNGLMHNLIPAIVAKFLSPNIPFNSFTDIDKLYIDGLSSKDENQKESLINQILFAGERLLKFEIPVIRRDRFAWLRDHEFARQTLAGVNPVNIELLKELPILSKLDPQIYGPPESAITKALIEPELNGMKIEEAIENKRLFILDHHDMFLPFIENINSLSGIKAYASRAVLFYTPTGILRPVIIELSLPPTPASPRTNRIFTPGHDATTSWLWKLAKAHVCSNDATIFQMVNHWMRIHACAEPYIIATHRQLSSMHPIYKLLHPHMRYTLQVNAFSRKTFISANGIVEALDCAGKYGVELSSAAYQNLWRFDMEALPADLVKRGMAVEDPAAPCGVKLVIEDYPYAADGLLLYSAIKELVESYVEHYYSEPDSVTSDVELQGWWNEIKNKGHPDKKDEPWWPNLITKEDLSGILTTMIWVVSGNHAAINFGQYPLGGYVLHRPTLMRKLIPQEEEPDYKQFLLDPEQMFLSSLPTQFQATKLLAVQDAVSTHSPDEEYLPQLQQLHSFLNNDQQVIEMYERFSARLVEIEQTIKERNEDATLINRCGAGTAPYELLIPSSLGPGVTGRGVPNSITN
ncbi:lipoxygenase 6, chloroplastic-like [Nicotiana tomentosiformis]|uniref:lipoxygenase 6, chloroplastic-like n=1 Tax=Nicotiana tomentosiformis TaxID=4098 RepID=UPI00051C81C4|nr:lipoxygenase 6, chloroplastic-like [Nicotiana tomentosiformis]XP_033515786.1 lipoxygenase 6, chloroplastic-like [Nicotiana tomentosiformis]